MKKIISLILSAVLLFGLIPSAFAWQTAPEVRVEAEKALLDASDLNEDGCYRVSVTAQVTGAGDAQIQYYWMYMLSGDTGARSCPASACSGSGMEMFFEPEDAFAGITVWCSVSGSGIVSAASERITVYAAPVITEDLPEIIRVSDEELTGESYELCCSVGAQGYGELKYAWEYSEDGGESWCSFGSDGSALKESIPSTLFFTYKTFVRCTVTDGNGNSSVSAYAQLRKQGKPVIFTDLPDTYMYLTNEYDAKREVYCGHTFTVEAVGEDLTWEWYISTDNGKEWIITDGDKASFAPVVTDDDFSVNRSFLVKAVVYSGETAFTETNICRCTSAPRILTDLPSDLYVNADEVQNGENGGHYTVSAKITAAGEGELFYKWYYSDTSSLKDPYKVFEGFTSDTLTDAPVPKEAVLFGARVFCEVSDAFGNTVTSSFAKITPVHPASVTIPESIRLYGSNIVDDKYTVRLTAEAVSKEKAEIAYTWYVKIGNGDWIKYGENSPEFEQEFTVDELLSPVRVKCVTCVLDRFTAESNEFHTEVAPYFYRTYQTSQVSPGDTGTLKADFRSTDEAVFTWLRSPDNYHWFEMTDDEKYFGTDTDTLTVADMTENEYYVYYRCRAVIGETTLYSQVAKFEKPFIKITSQPKDCESSVGKAAVFTVRAEGVSLTYKWMIYDNAAKLWKDISKTAAYEAIGVRSDTLTVNVNAKEAYGLKFRCIVSDGDKEMFTDAASIVCKENSGCEQFDPVNVLRGDTDLNGVVEAADARLALRASVGLETYAPDTPAFVAADWDANGKIEAADARFILRCAVGLK